MQKFIHSSRLGLSSVELKKLKNFIEDKLESLCKLGKAVTKVNVWLSASKNRTKMYCVKIEILLPAKKVFVKKEDAGDATEIYTIFNSALTAAHEDAIRVIKKVLSKKLTSVAY